MLDEYATFVDNVRTLLGNGMAMKEAIQHAIDWCIENDVLQNFLQQRRAEVEKVMVLDYTFENRMRMAERDSYEYGRSDSRAEGRVETLTELVKNNVLSTNVAASMVGMTEDAFIEAMKKSD